MFVLTDGAVTVLGVSLRVKKGRRKLLSLEVVEMGICIQLLSRHLGDFCPGTILQGFFPDPEGPLNPLLCLIVPRCHWLCWDTLGCAWKPLALSGHSAH